MARVTPLSPLVANPRQLYQPLQHDATPSKCPAPLDARGQRADARDPRESDAYAGTNARRTPRVWPTEPLASRTTPLAPHDALHHAPHHPAWRRARPLNMPVLVIPPARPRTFYLLAARAPCRSLKLFITTLTLLNAMAALATIGESIHPVNGYNAPAAIGIATMLYPNAHARF